MPYPVTHFEINAKDTRAQQKFYGDLFGWHIDTNQPGGYGLIDTHSAGAGINGGIAAAQGGRSFVTFYVETEDLEATLARATQLGGSVIVPPMSMGPVTFALFSDPEGNVVGLARDEAHPVEKAVKKTARKTAKKVVKKSTARKSTAGKATARKSTARKSTVRKSTRRSTRRR